MPSFAGTAAHETRLTYEEEGGVESPAFVRYMERLGDQKLQAFSTNDFLALDYIHREKPLPEHLKA